MDAKPKIWTVWTPGGLRDQAILTAPDCETRAMNGPGRELRRVRILGTALTKTPAISLPRRLPAVRTNTRALLARNAASSKGRYLNL
jgi:hypothetical protein